MAPRTAGTICHDRPYLSLQPATLFGRAAFEQRLPIPVDLGLVVAADNCAHHAAMSDLVLQDYSS